MFLALEPSTFQNLHSINLTFEERRLLGLTLRIYFDVK